MGAACCFSGRYAASFSLYAATRAGSDPPAQRGIVQAPANRKSVSATAAAKTEQAALPTSPTTWLTLDSESRNGLRKYAGKFKYKVPSMGERVDIDVLRAQYLQHAANVTGTGQAVSEALAYLAVTIDSASAPAWWKESKNGIELLDFAPLLSLYALGRAYEASFLGSGTDTGASANGVGDEPDDAAGNSVESDVPATPQRRTVLASFGARGDRTDSVAADASGEAGAGAGEGDG